MEVGNSGTGFYFDPTGAEEVSIQLGGNSSEFELGGVQVNLVPKAGGNTFQRLHVHDVHQRQVQLDGGARRAQGARAADHRRGGPRLRRQRIAGRPDPAGQALVLHAPTGGGATRSSCPGSTTTRTPRRGPTSRTSSRPAVNDNANRHNNARFTWQAAQKHRLNLSWDQEENCVCHVGSDRRRPRPRACTAGISGRRTTCCRPPGRTR